MARRDIGRLALSAALAALALGASPAAASLTSFGTTQDFLRGVDTDAAGNVYVAADSTIHEYTSTGAFVRDFGGAGSGDGQFTALKDVTVDAGGNVYGLDATRLQKLDPSGVSVWSITVPPDTDRIAAGSSGKVWAVEPNNRTVKAYAEDTHTVTQQFDVTAADASGGGPGDVALAPDGDLYVYVWKADQLRRYRSDGFLISTLSGPLPTSHGSAGTALGNDPAGNLLVAGEDAAMKYAANGNFLGRYDDGTRIFAGIAGGTGGRVFAVGRTKTSNCPCTNDVLRIDTVTPDARLAVSPSPALTGQTVAFDASASRVPLSSIAKYEWDLDGDGSFEVDAGTAPTMTTTYGSAGSRTARVRVTSRDGGSAVAEQSLDVRPAPPAGPVGISVDSGAQFTNDRGVTLSVVWPPLSSTLTVSNDGGFASASALPLAASVPWTLDSSGNERLPKTVYARFDGSSATFQDDIILDQVDPAVQSADVVGPSAVDGVAAKASARRYVVRTKARDGNSGVAQMQFARTKGHPRPLAHYERRTRVRSAPLFVRVRDRAHNFSRWKRLGLLDVAPATSRVRRGRSLLVRYAATRPATLVIKVVRRRRVVLRRSFEVGPGRGRVRIPAGRLPAGRYKLRSSLQRVTFEAPLRLTR
jgi:hypothetical protein